MILHSTVSITSSAPPPIEVAGEEHFISLSFRDAAKTRTRNLAKQSPDSGLVRQAQN